MVASPVLCDLDFDRPGKQFGLLRVPHSSNRSAYGQVLTPICVINGGEGPTLLFTGGVHGDESEGPMALIDFCRTFDEPSVNGRVIVIPALNLPGVEAGTRDCPLDGRNLNRVFPGNPDGTFTEVVAHYVTSTLFPMANVVVDFHSGGSTLCYIPTLLVHQYQGDLTASTEAAISFGAPMVLISRDLETAGFLGNLSEAAGILTVTAELGGGQIAPGTVEIARTGIVNLLRHFGVVEGVIQSPEAAGRAPTEIVEIEDLDAYIAPDEEGLYEPVRCLGEMVEAGTPVGRVYRPSHPWQPPSVCVAPRAGKIICIRPSAHVRPGDCVAIIGKVIG